MKPLNLGFLGLGTVGQGVCEVLAQNGAALAARGVRELCPLVACVRDAAKIRPYAPLTVTTDHRAVVCNPEVDVVVEVMGGVEPAKSWIEDALHAGKHVVTANKELIARHARELETIAAERGVRILYDAAVCGGIPVLPVLRHRLVANRIERIAGIVNGTTNYLLTRMSDAAAPYEQALQEAQERGYAEADPTADVENFDAQSKLAILATLAFGQDVHPDQVHREGIAHVAPRDIEFAKMLGYRIKPVAVAGIAANGIEARVHPALVPLSNPLSKVDGVDNAVLIRGDFVGDLMLLGKGAGAGPTASAIIGDLEELASTSTRESVSIEAGAVDPTIGVQNIEDTVARFYVRMTSQDRPKALGQIASAFGDYDVSLAALEMHELPNNRSELVFLTHPAREGNLKKALALIEHLPMIERIENWLRIEV
jgi:homoserine dehydrogenase